VALDAKMKRKATMASTIPASGACTSTNSSRTLHGLTVMTRSGFVEGGHQLEKLEFALAVAEARGDSERCSFLRDQITDLGGNAEEPGT
jgi:hypothetical protein|tara:strand:- start:375 stop:641 length:267 start_codon:yes stop_codon:yes gene_type:complete